MSSVKTAVIVLNWNGWDDTIECCSTLKDITTPGFVLIIVDNGSVDTSVESIRKYLLESFLPFRNLEADVFLEIDEDQQHSKQAAKDASVVLIKNRENYGFTGGNNVAIRFALDNAQVDNVVLLNNDTTVDREFLQAFLDLQKAQPSIGVQGAKILSYDNPSVVLSAGGVVDYQRGRTIQYQEPDDPLPYYSNLTANIDYVNGCCMFIDSRVIQSIGVLDDSFFAYWEESDFCARAIKAGFEIAYNPLSVVRHKVSKSSNKVNHLQLYYMNRNRIKFIRKNANYKQKFLFLCHLFAIRVPVAIFDMLLRSFSPRAFMTFSRAVRDGFLQ